MRLTKDCLTYLQGRNQSSSYSVRFRFQASDQKNRSRVDVLRELAAGKKLIHIGCVDHDISEMRVKLKHDQWLHKVLCDVAARCVGVDILGECIEELKAEFGCSDIYAGDILRDELPFMNGTTWDAIFLPEVLEHIDNPVSFLTGLRQRFAGQVKELVVSVPNALSCVYPPFVRRGEELVNTDHRYIFTPYTLAKVAVMAGYQVGDIVMCEYGHGSRRRVLRNWYLKKYPLARADIVMRLTPGS